jgi:hypothetical protein
MHDAVLIEAPLDKLTQQIALMQEIMAEASQIVLGNLRLRSDVKVIEHPGRYADERGIVMWDRVWQLLGRTDLLLRQRNKADVPAPTRPLSYLSIDGAV